MHVPPTSRVARATAVTALLLAAWGSCLTAPAGASATGPRDTGRPAGCARAQLPLGTSLGSARLLWTKRCVPFVRTPEKRFARVSGFRYRARYARVDGLRMAYLDEGPRRGQVILMLHGQPTWSYLYRKMLPQLVAAGYRVIAPDLIGMGRSDKPVEFADYSYLRHVRWVRAFVAQLRLRAITAFVQDWGSLIGLRVVGEEPGRFARVVVANGALPVIPEGFKLVTLPDPPTPNDALELSSVECKGAGSFCFNEWAAFALTGTRFRASAVLDASLTHPLSRAERRAYDAPFPASVYMAGMRVFPSLVNTVSEAPTNAAASMVLAGWTKPFLTLWGKRDPVFGGSTPFEAQLRDRVPGAKGQRNHTYLDAGHFIQEDKGPDLARRVRAFIRANPIRRP